MAEVVTASQRLWITLMRICLGRLVSFRGTQDQQEEPPKRSTFQIIPSSLGRQHRVTAWCGALETLKSSINLLAAYQNPKSRVLAWKVQTLLLESDNFPQRCSENKFLCSWNNTEKNVNRHVFTVFSQCCISLCCLMITSFIFINRVLLYTTLRRIVKSPQESGITK